MGMVVNAAVALGLAEHGQDAIRLDVTLIGQALQPGRIGARWTRASLGVSRNHHVQHSPAQPCSYRNGRAAPYTRPGWNLFL